MLSRPKSSIIYTHLAQIEYSLHHKKRFSLRFQICLFDPRSSQAQLLKLKLILDQPLVFLLFHREFFPMSPLAVVKQLVLKPRKHQGYEPIPLISKMFSFDPHQASFRLRYTERSLGHF